MDYIKYNREERDICAHLFRLLLADQDTWTPLKLFLDKTNVENPRIFSEVALIRDAYNERKDNAGKFLCEICEIIAEQNGITEYTSYSKLPEIIQNPESTHPKQISHKLRDMKYDFMPGDRTIYGSLQAMFNAKPDLAICEGDNLYVYEAKFTSRFDEDQMIRTKHIAQVWSELLHKDLGFASVPSIKVMKLGMEDDGVDISWEKIYSIARKCLGDSDYSTISLSKAMSI